MVRIAALCVFSVYLSPGLEDQPLKRPAPAIRHFRPPVRFLLHEPRATKSIRKIRILYTDIRLFRNFRR